MVTQRIFFIVWLVKPLFIQCYLFYGLWTVSIPYEWPPPTSSWRWRPSLTFLFTPPPLADILAEPVASPAARFFLLIAPPDVTWESSRDQRWEPSNGRGWSLNFSDPWQGIITLNNLFWLWGNGETQELSVCHYRKSATFPHSKFHSFKTITTTTTTLCSPWWSSSVPSCHSSASCSQRPRPAMERRGHIRSRSSNLTTLFGSPCFLVD